MLVACEMQLFYFMCYGHGRPLLGYGCAMHIAMRQVQLLQRVLADTGNAAKCLQLFEVPIVTQSSHAISS